MLTPFGNPQNLYIYYYFNINSFEFMKIMFFPFVVSFGLIVICCLFIKNEKIVLPDSMAKKIDRNKTIFYFVFFGFFLAIIFKWISYHIGSIVIILVFLLVNKTVLKKIDYPLLLTFFFFFIFAGNMARIDYVKDFYQTMLHKNTLLTGIFSSQLISNVPSAVLLSKFTDNYNDLLVAVNIGGTGTLVASLASLITYHEFTKHYPDKKRYFIGLFTIVNFSFLIILTLLSLYVY